MKSFSLVEKKHKKQWCLCKFTNLNKITIITNFLAFSVFYFKIVPSWIRMRIHADLDPQP